MDGRHRDWLAGIGVGFMHRGWLAVIGVGFMHRGNLHAQGLVANIGVG
jgi:hypothetical protein